MVKGGERLKKTFKSLSQELWAKNRWLSWRTKWPPLANKKGSNWTSMVSLYPRLRERCGKYGLTMWLTRMRSHHWTRPHGLRGSIFSMMASGKSDCFRWGGFWPAEPKCSQSLLLGESQIFQEGCLIRDSPWNQETHVWIKIHTFLNCWKDNIFKGLSIVFGR